MVTDKVRDVMLFTVPALAGDEEYGLVEPDVPMEDDGCEACFAKAYIRDEIPWMDLRHEVRDLMTVAVPDLECWEECESAYADLPDDGMEALWAEEASPLTAMLGAPLPTAIAPAPAVHMVAAPAGTAMIGVAQAPAAIPAPAAADVPAIAPVEAVLAICAAPVAEATVPEPAESVPEPAGEDAVLPETMTVTIPPAVQPIEAEDGPEEITEERTAVMFSFGSQEVRGSGWRVCFSF